MKRSYACGICRIDFESLFGIFSINREAFDMYHIGAGGTLPELELLALLSVSQGSLITILVIWQVMLSSCGLHPFHRLTQTIPMFVLEVRTRFDFRYWLVKMARFNLYSNGREKLIPSVISLKFLLRRDGRNIFDFFKAFSFNDVSPPVFA